MKVLELTEKEVAAAGCEDRPILAAGRREMDADVILYKTQVLKNRNGAVGACKNLVEVKRMIGAKAFGKWRAGR